MIELKELIAQLESRIDNPSAGLAEEVFLLLTRLTPMINVDLLIGNDHGETLLTWREDELHGSGWHIPGGIIRFQETAAARIAQVALNELHTRVEAEPAPLHLSEFIRPGQRNRSHFYSLLYRCRLTTPLRPADHWDGRRPPQTGQYEWFAKAPENLLQAHIPYRDFINGGIAL